MKKRNIVLISVALMITFIVGVAANPVIFQGSFAVSSGESRAKPAHMVINNMVLVIDPSSSTVEGVNLTVTSTYPGPTTSSAHNFMIVVQVSCLSSGVGTLFPPKPFICAGGSVSGNLFDGTTAFTVPVNFNRAVDPELTQIEDLSFIINELAASPVLPPLGG